MNIFRLGENLILFKNFLDILTLANKITSGLIKITTFNGIIEFLKFIIIILATFWQISFIIILKEDNYKKLEKIKQNKEMFKKIMKENNYFLKYRYPFLTTYFILLICYGFVLFNTALNQIILFYLIITIPFAMYMLLIIDIGLLFEKGVIQKYFNVD